MDFKRTWTPFALEAEYEHFGTFRFVKAHNERVSELELQLIAAQEQIISLKNLMSDIKAFAFNVNPYRIEPKDTLEDECEELRIGIGRLRKVERILREGLEKYADENIWYKVWEDFDTDGSSLRFAWEYYGNGPSAAQTSLKAAEEVKG